MDKSLTNLKKQKLFNELASNSITDGIKRSKTNECTEFALIDRILSQKAPRIKLRELIKKSSQALLDMKPCFIMSPTALSELVAAKENFFDLLKENNINVKKQISFPDHYNYSKKELDKLLKISKENNLKLLTTEKDFFRIKHFNITDIDYLTIKLEIINEDLFEKELRKHLI